MTEPTDAEAWEMWLAQPLTGHAPKSVGNFARAVLAKWGTPPAVVGEPVAWLSTDCLGERYLCFTKPNDSDPAQPLVFCDATPQPTQAQAGAVPLTESEMGEGWRKFQETLDDRMAADPAGVRSMGREHWLSWAHWKAACNFAHGIKGGQHGAD